MGLSIKPNGVIRQGTSGSDYWTLYSDGTLIKCGTFTFSGNVSTFWGTIPIGTYVSAETTLTYNTTIPFTTVPTITFSVSNATTTNWVDTVQGSTTMCTYQVCRASSATAVTNTIGYFAIGRG
jgi:hypothetical protein